MFRLRRGRNDEALDLLQKAAATASGSSAVLREIVVTLVNFGLADPAAAFLKRFPPETHAESDYLCSDVALLNLVASVEDVIVRGRKLLRDGVQDPLLHRIMIRREREVGHTETAERLCTEASTIWPRLADEFQHVLDTAVPKAKT